MLLNRSTKAGNKITQEYKSENEKKRQLFLFFSSLSQKISDEKDKNNFSKKSH